MSDPREWRFLLVAALGLTLAAGLWTAGWAVREMRDFDPPLLLALSSCLEGQHALRIMSPAGDPLADSAPGGSLRTTIEGNSVTVSIWNDADGARATLETYARLTPENLEGRATASGRRANLWSAPPTSSQASKLYGCEV